MIVILCCCVALVVAAKPPIDLDLRNSNSHFENGGNGIGAVRSLPTPPATLLGTNLDGGGHGVFEIKTNNNNKQINKR